MHYVMSDLHGCPLEKVTSLLDTAGFGENDDLYVLGDVIDRGDNGIALLRWIMRQVNVSFIVGNHEAMMLGCDFLIREVTDDSIYQLTPDSLNTYMTWLYNGAQPTVDALTAVAQSVREDIFDFIAFSPFYEAITVGGRDFILTHSGLGNFSPEKKLDDYTAHDLLWTRPSLETRYFDDITVVFGHTPTQFYGSRYDKHALASDTWINIDAGCACGNDPILLRLDDMTEFSSEGTQTVTFAD